MSYEKKIKQKEKKNTSPKDSIRNKNDKKMTIKETPNIFMNQNLNSHFEPNCINSPLNKNIGIYGQNHPLIGLENIGITSYMNATLQCLSNIEQLTNYFRNNSYVEHIVKFKPDSLAASYKRLIHNLWPSNNNHQIFNHNKSYAPYDFKNKISKMNSLFEGIHANDSKDLLNFIITTLHEELNKSKKNGDLHENITSQIDEQLELKEFIENFINENRSIISDLFYGVNETIIICSNCKIPKYNFSIDFCLRFPLEEVRKFKLDQLNKNNNIMNQFEKNSKIKLLNENIIDFKDCFDFDKKIGIFDGDNAMYCDICKKQNDATYQTLLYTLPNILIIILNRGVGKQFKVKLEFTELLDLNDYAKYGGKYELISVITHLGESGFSGHFIASCKSHIDKEWYQYNDSIVKKIYDFKNEVLNFGDAYILFYKKKN